MDSRLKALAAWRSRESMARTAPLRRSPTSRPKECPFCASCRPAGRRATRSQILAIHGIATRQGINLDSLLRDRYRVCQLYELSVSEASRLIDELKASTNKAEGQR